MSRTGASMAHGFRWGREYAIVCRGGWGASTGSVLAMNQWEESSMRKGGALVAICAGACMLLVDVTIVNVALPDMARQLHTTFSDLQWVIDLYALVLGALVLTIGSVADRFGRRKLYLIGLVLFAVASLACGLAPNVALLIAAR